MKKLLLTLGTISAIALPITSVVACGSTPGDKDAYTNASTAQTIILGDLSNELESTFGGTGKAPTIDLKGDVARFTFNTTSSATDFESADEPEDYAPAEKRVRISVDVYVGKIVKVEMAEVGEDFKKVNISDSDLTDNSQTLKPTILDAKVKLIKLKQTGGAIVNGQPIHNFDGDIDGITASEVGKRQALMDGN